MILGRYTQARRRTSGNKINHSRRSPAPASAKSSARPGDGRLLPRSEMTRSEAPDPSSSRPPQQPNRRPAKPVRSPTRRVIPCTSRRDSGRPQEFSPFDLTVEFHGALRHGPPQTDFPPTRFFEGNSSALHNPQPPLPQPNGSIAVRPRGSASVDALVQRTLRPCNSSPAWKAPKSWRWDDWFSARLSDWDEGRYRGGAADEMHPENSLAVRPR